MSDRSIRERATPRKQVLSGSHRAGHSASPAEQRFLTENLCRIAQLTENYGRGFSGCGDHRAHLRRRPTLSSEPKRPMGEGLNGSAVARVDMLTSELHTFITTGVDARRHVEAEAVIRNSETDCQVRFALQQTLGHCPESDRYQVAGLTSASDPSRTHASPSST